VLANPTALIVQVVEVAPRSHGSANRGYLRASATQQFGSVELEKAHPLTPSDRNGKEGVDGSSPSEGSQKFRSLEGLLRGSSCRSCRLIWHMEADVAPHARALF